MKQPDPANPPAYPGAVVVSDDPPPKEVPLKRTVLETDADVQTVLSFYRDALVKDGWQLDPASPSADLISVHYSNCCQFGWLTALVQHPNDKTEVTIQRAPFLAPCK